jgi:hypothetical protein
LNVLAKFGEERLEWGPIAEAFAGCEVHRQDDLLDFLVGDLINIEMARKSSRSS